MTQLLIGLTFSFIELELDLRLKFLNGDLWHLKGDLVFLGSFVFFGEHDDHNFRYFQFLGDQPSDRLDINMHEIGIIDVILRVGLKKEFFFLESQG